MEGQRKIAPPAPEMGYYIEGEGTVMKRAEMGTGLWVGLIGVGTTA